MLRMLHLPSSRLNHTPSRLLELRVICQDSSLYRRVLLYYKDPQMLCNHSLASQPANNTHISCFRLELQGVACETSLKLLDRKLLRLVVRLTETRQCNQPMEVHLEQAQETLVGSLRLVKVVYNNNTRRSLKLLLSLVAPLAKRKDQKFSLDLLMETEASAVVIHLLSSRRHLVWFLLNILRRSKV